MTTEAPPVTSREAVAEAEARATEAAADAQRLEEKMKEGADVSPSQLRAARRQAEDAAWEAQRAEGAFIRWDLETASDAAEELYGQMVESRITDLGAVVEAGKALRGAVVTFLEAVKAHLQGVNEDRARWATIRPKTIPYGQDERLPVAFLRFLGGEKPGGDFGNIGGVVVERLRPARLTLSIVGEALAESLHGASLEGAEQATIRELGQGPTGADWPRVQQTLETIRERGASPDTSTEA